MIRPEPSRQAGPLVDGQTKPFDPAGFGACTAEEQGYSTLYDAAFRATSLADAMVFLQRYIRL